MEVKKLFPHETVIKTELFNIGQDWEVPIPAFFILSPLRKIRSFSDFTDEEADEFMRLLIKLRRGMEEVLGIKDVYFFQNEDTAFNHFHLWIFPRHDWMERFGRKIESVRPIMKYAEENMVNDEVFAEVRETVKKMKKYMEG